MQTRVQMPSEERKVTYADSADGAPVLTLSTPERQTSSSVGYPFHGASVETGDSVREMLD